MADRFTLRPATANRVLAATERVERELPPPPRRGKRRDVGLSPPFWVELTGEDPAAAGWYKWKKIYPTADDFEDTDPLIDSGTDVYSAHEANDTSGLTGKRVKIEFNGYDATPAAVYLFGGIGATGHHTVDLTSTSGTGTAADPYVYTAKKEGTALELGTNLTPAKGRTPGQDYSVATKGTGDYDANGDFRLVEAWETELTEEACEPEV